MINPAVRLPLIKLSILLRRLQQFLMRICWQTERSFADVPFSVQGHTTRFFSFSSLGEAGSSLLFFFLVCRLNNAQQNSRWFYGSLSSGGAWQHAETLHGIVPGIIIVRVAPFCRPLGTFHKQLR
jgi:hypothetical protein